VSLRVDPDQDGGHARLRGLCGLVRSGVEPLARLRGAGQQAEIRFLGAVGEGARLATGTKTRTGPPRIPPLNRHRGSRAAPCVAVDESAWRVRSLGMNRRNSASLCPSKNGVRAGEFHCGSSVMAWLVSNAHLCHERGARSSRKTILSVPSTDAILRYLIIAGAFYVVSG